MIWMAAALAGGVDVPYTELVLDNGLTVLLHEDHSDPVVALATVVHVGSAREVRGRTGFAHFFEHMAFNDSENVPRGANRKRIEELGGRRNGGTTRDYTIYYEVVPTDAFEKLLWIDSDRLGYMINTVTDGALENEKQVVKNEKRQRVDNAAYGHRGGVIAANLYPEDHPYSWPVIGSLEDLQAAQLTDVRAFYDRWYGPNNATLVVAGDFDMAQAKKWVTDYFGEIPRGPDVEDPEPRPVTLDDDILVMHEDAFAKLPDLRITLPTVERGHDDEAALDVLGTLLSDGKRAPLYKELVEKRKIAQSVYAWQGSSELAGTFTLGVRAKPGVDLDEVRAGIDAALTSFANDPIDEVALTRVKALSERGAYDRLQGVLDKAWALASSASIMGDPTFFSQEIERVKAVEAADVKRVFERWVAKKPGVVTSFVPEGSKDLAVEGSSAAKVAIEAVVKGAEAPPAEDVIGEYPRTETVFDRSSEPPFGPTEEPPLPQVERLDVGALPVRFVPMDEVPLVSFSIRVDGGHRTEPIPQSGMTSLLAELLMEGTRDRDAEALEDAIGALGSSIRVSAGRDGLTVTGECLADTFDATFALAVEVLTRPGFDAEAFERLKDERLNSFVAREGNAQALSGLAGDALLYGPEHPYGWPIAGVKSTIEPLTVKDLKRRHKASVNRSSVSVQVVGDVTADAVRGAASSLNDALSNRKSKTTPVPERATPTPRLVFVDVPKSKQSVLLVGRLMHEGGGEDAEAMGFAINRLGGGSSGALFQTLRIDKGFTYGAYMSMYGRTAQAPMMVRTSVRANVTRESMNIIEDLVADYASTYSDAELDVTKTVYGKRDALRFETLRQRRGHLEDLAQHDLPEDWAGQRRKLALDSDVDGVRQRLQEWADVEDFVWIVVGDGDTQREEMKSFGLPFEEWTATDINAGTAWRKQ